MNFHVKKVYCSKLTNKTLLPQLFSCFMDLHVWLDQSLSFSSKIKRMLTEHLYSFSNKFCSWTSNDSCGSLLLLYALYNVHVFSILIFVLRNPIDTLSENHIFKIWLILCDTAFVMSKTNYSCKKSCMNNTAIKLWSRDKSCN